MFIVIEMQTDSENNVATIVDTYATQNEADSKFFLILSAAAVSSVPLHAAAILRNDGRMVRFESYNHQPDQNEEE